MGLFSGGIITMGLVCWGKVNMSLLQIHPSNMHHHAPASSVPAHQHQSH
jgi:hypothetical protein